MTSAILAVGLVAAVVYAVGLVTSFLIALDDVDSTRRFTRLYNDADRADAAARLLTPHLWPLRRLEAVRVALARAREEVAP